MTPIEIGITGGIGSGKSIVSHILRIMGYPVYDTDSQAKLLMDTPALRQQLTAVWGDSIILPNGEINRPQLSAIVFHDPTQLAQLNAIVHPAVRSHYAEWVQQQSSPIVFVESAILHQAGMDHALHYIWVVEADAEMRIERVMKRSNLTYEQIEERIKTQQPYPYNERARKLLNDNKHALLPQIMELLRHTILT